MSTDRSSTLSVTVPTASIRARLRRAPGAGVFVALVAVAVVLVAAASLGTVERLGGADSGLVFSSLRGHVTSADSRWATVEPGDHLVEIAGRKVSGPESIRAAWNQIEPGPLTIRFRRGEKEWQETAEARPFGAWVRISTWLRIATGIVLLAVGAVVFVLRPGRPVTWSFFGFCFALASHLLVYQALLPWPPEGVIVESVAIYASAGAGVLLFTLFPSPLFRRRRWAALFFLPAVVAAAALAWSYRRAGGFATAVAVIGGGYFLAVAAGLVCVGLIVAQYRRALRQAEPVDASKCRALLVAVVLGLVVPAILGTLKIGSEFDFAAKSLPVVFFVAVAAYSIVRHNAFDVDRFTAALVGYAATTVGLVVVFGVLLIAVPSLVGWSGVLDSPLSGAASAAAFFLLFSPAYRRVRTRVDRVFLRAGVAEEERLRLLRELAETVRSAELSTALESAVATAATLNVTRAEVWTSGADGSYGRFGEGTGTETAESIPPDNALIEALEGGSGGVQGLAEQLLAAEAQKELWARELALAVPIVASDRLQGFVALGRKRNGTAYSKQERAFVETVASHLAIAFERSSGRATRLGPYRILERLGTGGMAEVFLAAKQGPGGFELLVALKRMLPHLSDDPDCVAMFLDEARIAAQLSHPNIVRILDIESLQGRYFLAMEYVDGPTLAALLRAAGQTGKALPLAVGAAIAVAMLRALQAAHTRGDRQGRPLHLVHRDVKPGNLLLSRQGEVKLGDFGIARAEFRLYSTEPGQARGTRPYMAPEIWDGRVGAAADLFSAGAVIYEMVTGEVAFPRGTEALRSDPPAALGRDLPKGLRSFFDTALAGDPSVRFASAEAMREAFLEAIGPVEPAPPEAVAEAVRELCPPRSSDRSVDPSLLLEEGPETEPTRRDRRFADDLPPTERG